MNVADLKELVLEFKKAIKSQTGKEFPSNPMEQLWGAICAVFTSWMNERAILYRKMEVFHRNGGTAVTVQAMVFGNMAKLLPQVFVFLVMLVMVRMPLMENTW